MKAPRWLAATGLLGLASVAFAQEPELVQPAELVGTWAMRLKLAVIAEVPVLGDSRTVNHRTNLATIRLEDGELVQEHKACTVRVVAEQDFAKPIVPQAFTDNLPVKSYPVELRELGDQLRYDVDLQVEVMGYDADKPEPVPDDKRDRRLEDTDQDGKPAITFLVDAPFFGRVEVYAVQLAHTVLKGRVIDADRIVGSAEMLILEQRILDSSNLLFTRGAEVRPDNPRSAFEMRRVPEGSDCEDL